MAQKNKKIETEEQKKARELVEGIAANIANLARSVVAMMNGPLKKKAIVRLLAASSGETMERVEAIIKALENMEADWLNTK